MSDENSYLPTMSENDGRMEHTGAATILNVFLAQQRMEDQLKALVADVSDLKEARKEDHFTKKDIVGACMAAVLSMGVIFGGLSYLISVQVSPVGLQLNNLQTHTDERFQSHLESIKANRASNEQQDKTVATMMLEVTQLKFQIEELRRGQDQHK